MRQYLIAASIAALAASGTAAQSATVCKQDNTGRTIATIAGAGIGALLGNVIDGGGNRAAGTIIGGVGGAIRGPRRCPHSWQKVRCDGFSRPHVVQVMTCFARLAWTLGRCSDGPGWMSGDARRSKNSPWP